MQWSCNGRGATHFDKVGAAAPVLALVLVLVVAVSMYGAGFVGGGFPSFYFCELFE